MSTIPQISLTDAMGPTIYIPSGKTPEQVIDSCNQHIPSEIALPGNWSPELFYSELLTYPVISKSLLSESLAEAVRRPNSSYLNFFTKTRGYAHPLYDGKEKNTEIAKIFAIFSGGSVMLYFEKFFLKILGLFRETRGSVFKVSPTDQIIISYIEALSQKPITEWNEIVKGVGACRYEYFAKEPELYGKLFFRPNKTDPEWMTDFELLASLEPTASPTQLFFRAPTDGSHSALIAGYSRNTVKPI